MWLASREEKVSECLNSCRRSSGVGIGWCDMTMSLLIWRRSKLTLISSVDHLFAVMTMFDTYVPASSGPCSGPSMMSLSDSSLRYFCSCGWKWNGIGRGGCMYGLASALRGMSTTWFLAFPTPWNMCWCCPTMF